MKYLQLSPKFCVDMYEWEYHPDQNILEGPAQSLIPQAINSSLNYAKVNTILVILVLLANYLAWVGGILPIALRRSLSTVTKKIRADFHIRKPLKNFLSTLEILSLLSKQQFYPISSFSKFAFLVQKLVKSKNKGHFPF